MANLDYIFKKAQALSYIGDGTWHANCPVKGCIGHNLSIRQTNLYQRRNGEVSEPVGTVTCSHGCSFAEIIDAYEFHPEDVFLQERLFEFDPENYTCLLDSKESLEVIKQEMKCFLELLESKDFDKCLSEKIDRFWLLAAGLRWLLISGHWSILRKPSLIEEVSTSKNFGIPF